MGNAIALCTSEREKCKASSLNGFGKFSMEKKSPSFVLFKSNDVCYRRPSRQRRRIKRNKNK